MDLILLAIDEKHGTIRNQHLVTTGLAAAELVELALTGHVTLDGAHLVATRGIEPPQDELLKASLANLSAGQWPTTVSDWIQANWARASSKRYLARLQQAGTISLDTPPRSAPNARGDRKPTAPLPHVEDHERAQAAVNRFRAGAHGAATAMAMAMATVTANESLAALADAAGLTDVHLGGHANKHARERLSGLTARRTGTVPEPDRTVQAIVRFATRTMKELAQQKHSDYSNGTELAPIPVGSQFAIKNGLLFVANANPNMP